MLCAGGAVLYPVAGFWADRERVLSDAPRREWRVGDDVLAYAASDDAEPAAAFVTAEIDARGMLEVDFYGSSSGSRAIRAEDVVSKIARAYRCAPD
eukprot:934465-Rhodomonas_salina.1